MYGQSTEAILVFGGLLLISIAGYWTSARRSDAMDRAQRDRPAPQRPHDGA